MDLLCGPCGARLGRVYNAPSYGLAIRCPPCEKAHLEDMRNAADDRLEGLEKSVGEQRGG